MNVLTVYNPISKDLHIKKCNVNILWTESPHFPMRTWLQAFSIRYSPFLFLPLYLHAFEWQTSLTAFGATWDLMLFWHCVLFPSWSPMVYLITQMQTDRWGHCPLCHSRCGQGRLPGSQQFPQDFNLGTDSIVCPACFFPINRFIWMFLSCRLCKINVNIIIHYLTLFAHWMLKWHSLNSFSISFVLDLVLT